MSAEKRYWDSTVIIAYLNNEQQRADICQAILDEAAAGNIVIYISALSMAEALKYRSRKPIAKENRQKVVEFFQNDYIRIINVDRFIARDAQELYWENGIDPKDAIIVATALKNKFTVMETYDDALITKSKTVGSPPLEIRYPTKVQMGLPLLYEDQKETEETEI